MKILLLVIFSHSDIYNQMLTIQKEIVNSNSDIDTYFVTFNNDQDDDIVINDNIMYVKGSESYTNILYKTIKGLDYIIHTKSQQYDYIVRSNISTILHLSNLCAYLDSLPRNEVYTGCTLETLRWMLAPYEILETKQHRRNDYYGVQYIQGTCIILSRDVVQYLLSIQSTIEYDIVDDVKIGLIIRDHLPVVYNAMKKLPLAKVTYNNMYEPNTVCIRNRSSNRLSDVHRMRTIISDIYSDNISRYSKTIYITRKEYDDKLQAVAGQWKVLNPEYSIELYDDQRCLQFLQQYYGDKYCNIFHYIKDGAIKADFFRVCILYIYGGVYADADIKPSVPLCEYVDSDVDLMTCISYNYGDSSSFGYNPQLIVAKKYSTDLYKIIQKYEHLYDNKVEYNYWMWSICKQFEKIHNFNIQYMSSNLFVYNNKNYQFIIEQIVDKTNGETYIFETFPQHRERLLKQPNLHVQCIYMGKVVLHNFMNK
ncbi:MAG: glycosyltransferase [Flavobacterium sp.]